MFQKPCTSYVQTLAASVKSKWKMMLNNIFLVMGIFSFLFGRAQEKTIDIFPGENFSIIEGKIDDKPVIGSFNKAYKMYTKKGEYPWCLKIAIGLELSNLYENGLPNKEESDVANKLEDELFTDIKKLGVAHYIGHLFNDTFLDVYIYLANPESVHKYLQTQVNKEGLIRGFGYEINQDPNWTFVQEFIK